MEGIFPPQRLRWNQNPRRIIYEFILSSKIPPRSQALHNKFQNSIDNQDYYCLTLNQSQLHKSINFYYFCTINHPSKLTPQHLQFSLSTQIRHHIVYTKVYRHVYSARNYILTFNKFNLTFIYNSLKKKHTFIVHKTQCTYNLTSLVVSSHI